RHRHREVGFSRAGWTDTENDIVAADRIDVDFLVDALGRNNPLVRRDVNRVEENVLELGVPIAAENPNRVLHIAWVNRMPALEQIVQLGNYLASESLFRMSARNPERRSRDSHTNAERLLDRANMSVVLAEQIGEQAWVVEMEFERVFSC